MRFLVKKPLSSNADGKLYKPGEIYDDGGRLTEYERELLETMGVIEPAPDESLAANRGE